MKAIFFVLLLFSLNVKAVIISTVFGDVEEKNPEILELFDSRAIQRLKAIDQAGPQKYFLKDFNSFSRYDHSVGVYSLLKRYNLSKNEQMAGLLHDASHTVFSHVADILFTSDIDNSYQDKIHDWYLQKAGVESILTKYKLKLHDVSPENTKFTALEQEYPDMSADRIEYNLHTGIILGDLTKDDLSTILNALYFENNKWFFKDLFAAKKFAKLSTKYTKNFWGCKQNVAFYAITKALLKRAIDINIINYEDIHFGEDEQILSKIKACEDKILGALFNILNNIDEYYEEASIAEYDLHQKVKMRGIDPLVLHNKRYERLSELNDDFKQELEATREYAAHGVYIKFKNIDEKILALLCD